MALVYVHCPECQSIDVVQYGKQANGTQRYRCNNRDCPRTIFLSLNLSQFVEAQNGRNR
jgi:transposase-like protein